MAQSLSIIIPTLNEAANILNTLQRLPLDNSVEIIVVDGGSQDDTMSMAASTGVKVIAAPRGRANQMNLGAKYASGNILLFLHGDTYLPTEFPQLIRHAIGQSEVVGGAFALKIDSQLRGIKFIETMANYRSRFLSLPYGDQAIFVRADIFHALGGFPPLPIMEDFQFIRHLTRQGKIAIIPTPAVTSARRWESLGIVKTTVINQAIVIGYYLGVSPDRLVTWYRQTHILLQSKQKSKNHA
jgi:rSAM/selenodomain-associated transferase 2